MDLNKILQTAFREQQTGNLKNAKDNYLKVIKYIKTVPVFYNLAVVFYELGEVEEAINHYYKALEIDSNNLDVLNNLSIVLMQHNRVDEAIKLLEVACKNEFLYNNLAVAYREKKEFEKAYINIKKSLEINPQNGEALFNKGLILLDLNKIVEALEFCNRAISINPNREYIEKTAFIYLAIGDLNSGFKYYLYRNKDLNSNINFPKTDNIKLFREQGIGDELFFLRFSPMLKELGFKLSYNPSNKIKSIIERHKFIDVLEEVEFDENSIFIGDLPLFLNCKIALPLKLTPRDDLVCKYKKILNYNKKLIALTYRAGICEFNKLYKEIDLNVLIPILKTIDAKFIIVQRNPTHEEIELLKKELDIVDFSELNDNLEEMLALLSLVDDYISVSNTNVHLYAGLDKLARILVPFFPEWRWGYEKSLWFGENFKTYRQDKNLSWREALEKLEIELKPK